MDYSKKDERSLRTIVFDILDKIVEVSSQESRGGYFEEKIVGQIVERIYIGDKRKEFTQLVQLLKDFLMPHFDKDIEPIYEKIQKGYEKLEDEKIEKVSKGDKGYDSVLQSIKQLKLMEELFRELNKLLFRSKYLKKEMEFG